MAREDYYSRLPLYFSGGRRLPDKRTTDKKKKPADASSAAGRYLWGIPAAERGSFRGVSSVGLERHPDTVEVVGSSPIRLTS